MAGITEVWVAARSAFASVARKEVIESSLLPSLFMTYCHTYPPTQCYCWLVLQLHLLIFSSLHWLYWAKSLDFSAVFQLNFYCRPEFLDYKPRHCQCGSFFIEKKKHRNSIQFSPYYIHSFIYLSRSPSACRNASGFTVLNRFCSQVSDIPRWGKSIVLNLG